MKILVLNLQGAISKTLFSDERLENLRRLMDMGCFGELKGEASEWNVLARQEKHTLTLLEYLQQAEKRCANFEDFTALQNNIASQAWDYCELIKNIVSFSAGSDSADEYLYLDRELGNLLEHLDDDTIINIVGKDCFILVSSNNPISGEHKDGFAFDVAPTLLELAGFPLPSTIEGKSWVAGIELKSSSGLTEEEEAILRERLSGLGYI